MSDRPPPARADGTRLCADALRWWTVWREAPQAAVFTDDDWRELAEVARLVDDYYCTDEVSEQIGLLREIWRREEALGYSGPITWPADDSIPWPDDEAST